MYLTYNIGRLSHLSKGEGMASYPTFLKGDGDGYLSIVSKGEWWWNDQVSILSEGEGMAIYNI